MTAGLLILTRKHYMQNPLKFRKALPANDSRKKLIIFQKSLYAILKRKPSLPDTLDFRRAILANDSRKKLIIFQKSLYTYYADAFIKNENVSNCLNAFKDNSPEWKDFCQSVTEYNDLKL